MFVQGMKRIVRGPTLCTGRNDRQGALTRDSHRYLHGPSARRSPLKIHPPTIPDVVCIRETYNAIARLMKPNNKEDERITLHSLACV